MNTTLLVYVLGIYLAFRIAVCTVDTIFPLLLFLIPNLGILQISIGETSIPILNILMGIASLKVIAIYFFQKNQFGFYLVLGVFLFYEWSHVFYYDGLSVMLLLSWSAAVIYVYVYFYNSTQTYDHRKAVIYFIIGLIISTIYGILDFYQIYGTLLTNNATIRFKGGAGDPNYYAMYIMIALFTMLFLVNRASNTAIKFLYPLLLIFFTSFGVLSLSRMFLLVVSLLFMLLLLKVLLTLKKNRKIMKLLTFVVCLCLFPAVYFGSEFQAIFELLLSRFTDFADNPDLLTSNRNVLAETYSELMISNPFLALFGLGIQDYAGRSGIGLETHNILLEIFVVWGIVGFFIFVGFVLKMIKFVKRERAITRTSIICWLPFICMGISYMSINALSNESFFLLLLFAVKNIHVFDD